MGRGRGRRRRARRGGLLRARGLGLLRGRCRLRHGLFKVIGTRNSVKSMSILSRSIVLVSDRPPAVEEEEEELLEEGEMPASRRRSFSASSAASCSFRAFLDASAASSAPAQSVFQTNSGAQRPPFFVGSGWLSLASGETTSPVLIFFFFFLREKVGVEVMEEKTATVTAATNGQHRN